MVQYVTVHQQPGFARIFKKYSQLRVLHNTTYVETEATYW